MFKSVRGFIKTKLPSVLIAVCAFAVGFAMTGCGDDPPAELDKAVGAFKNFAQSAGSDNNFTVIVENDNSIIWAFYADGDKTKYDRETITYTVKEQNVLYSIFQTDDSVWHKIEANSEVYDANKIIDWLIERLNYVSWNEFNSQTQTLEYNTDPQVGTATATLETDKLTITTIEPDISVTITLKEIGNTTVTLPENIENNT